MIPVSMCRTRWRGRRSVELTTVAICTKEASCQDSWSATGAVNGASFQQFERRSLCATRHRLCRAQVAWPVMLAEAFDHLMDGGREICGGGWCLRYAS